MIISKSLWFALNDLVQANVPKYAGVAFVVKSETVVNVYPSFPHIRHTLDALDTERGMAWIILEQQKRLGRFGLDLVWQFDGSFFEPLGSDVLHRDQSRSSIKSSIVSKAW